MMRRVKPYSYTQILLGMIAGSRKLFVRNAGLTMRRRCVFGMRLFQAVHSIDLKAIATSSWCIRGGGSQRECRDCQSRGRHPTCRYVWSRVVVVYGLVVGDHTWVCPRMHVHVVECGLPVCTLVCVFCVSPKKNEHIHRERGIST